MLKSVIDRYFEFCVKTFAYGIGYAMLSITYLLSFVFPPLKKLIAEYEGSATTRSKSVIALITAIIIDGAIVYLNDVSNVNYTLTEVIFSGLAFFALGYYALVMLFEYKKRNASIA